MGEKRARYWGDEGPTSAARANASLYGSARDALSRGEWMMVRIALDVWDHSGNVHLLAAAVVLDAQNTELVCSLILAANKGVGAVDQWIYGHGGGTKKSPGAVKKAGGTNVVPIRRSRRA
jgi:hypothetical protein